MSVPLSVDVTTGDAITPGAVDYDFHLFFDDYSIPLVAYPLETCMAEKIETAIRRGRANTRPRDFYDIYALWATRRGEFDLSDLRSALEATSDRRGSRDVIGSYREVMESVASDEAMLGRWESFAKDYRYVGNLSLQAACNKPYKAIVSPVLQIALLY